MKRKFNYTESELYSLCLTGWEVCIKFLSFISAFSPKYTLEFIQAKKEEILTLMAQFSHGQRNTQLSGLRRELNQSSIKALKCWRSLKLYIEIGFPPDQRREMLKEAGLVYFRSAQRKQWEETLKLLVAGRSFIETHLTHLTQNQNMPEEFVLEFGKILEDFKTKFETYVTAGVSQIQKTKEHTAALNAIYDEVSVMFAIGREVFKEDKSIHDQFKFSRNLRIMSGIGWAGIKGKVYDENGKMQLIEGLEINLVETEDVVTQEEDGSFFLNQLSAGSYIIRVLAPGYKTIEKTVEVKVDTYTLLDFTMEKALESELEKDKIV